MEATRPMDIPVAVIMDHDRTRGRVDAAVDRLLGIAARYGIDVPALQSERAHTEADGMSFDPLAHIRKHLGAEYGSPVFSQLRQAFVAGGTAAHELLYTDVDDFERKLAANGIPYIVCTAGTNTIWQEWKIRASGYTGYIAMIEVAPGQKTPPKGPLISSWQDLDGHYPFKGIHKTSQQPYHVVAQNIMLIDDKALSFQGMPDNSLGIYIQRDEERLPSQGSASELPDNCSISTVSTLVDIQLNTIINSCSSHDGQLDILYQPSLGTSL